MKWGILAEGGERVKHMWKIGSAWGAAGGYFLAATMVKRMVPMRLMSLTCSPV